MSGEIVVTDDDRRAASAVMIESFKACAFDKMSAWDHHRPPCDCDLGAIDGCKVKREAIARAIATARAAGAIPPITPWVKPNG